MFQKMNCFIYPQHLQTFFHKNILENLTLQFFPGKACGSFSVSHLTDPLMHTEAVKTGDIQILLRLLFVFKSLLKYIFLLAGDLDTFFGMYELLETLQHNL